MTKDKDVPQEGQTETVARKFTGYGVFRVRGILAGERLEIQSKCMTVDTGGGGMDVDAKKLSLSEVSACLMESPEGPHPNTLYLEKLPSGVIETLSRDIKGLSTPDSEILKN